MSGSLLELTLYEKQIRGALYGSSNGAVIPRLFELYNAGHDELITHECTLDQVNGRLRRHATRPQHPRIHPILMQQSKPRRR